MSITLTQRDLITRAFSTIQVYSPGEPLSAEAVSDGRMLLAELIDNWATQALTVLTVDRAVYALVSGQGSPSNPYTFGPGGDWDTGAGERPQSIQTANLILNSSSPAVEIPLAIVTDDQYAAQAIKTQTNPQPQWLYYNPTSPLGLVYLWNVPTNATNEIALYCPVLTPQFVSLSAAYVCPPGYAKAFRLCLAQALMSLYACPSDVAITVTRDADDALRDLKDANASNRMADLSLDVAFTPNLHGSYVIQTDQGA